jgi:hypothetical protein
MRSLDLNNLLSCHLLLIFIVVFMVFYFLKELLYMLFLWHNDRYLRYLDYEVFYVRNFTDIDDKVTC